MKSKNVKPFVLVPGAWLGGWVWKRVAPLIQEKGYSVFPVTLTGMGDRVHLATKEVGVETAVRDVQNVIEYEDLEDIILVGHSFAGKIVGGRSRPLTRKSECSVIPRCISATEKRQDAAGEFRSAGVRRVQA